MSEFPKIENPFLLKSYAGPEYFCDRYSETKTIIDNAKNGINTTLIAIRRMGKTGLLNHVLYQLKSKKEGVGIYTDMYDTENLRDFTNKIANGILRAFPEKDPLWKKAFEFLKLLRPIITLDEFSGQPEVTLDFTKPKQFENTLMELFNFLEQQNLPVLVVIDEFQQIGTYPEKNIEAVLRSKIQTLKNVHFVFSGSSPHILADMFYSSKRPFYQSTQALHLKKIDKSLYKAFIRSHFEAKKRQIHDDAIDFILDFTKTHTFYTQLLCNRLFISGGKKITYEVARAQAMELLQLNEVIYFQYRNMLTSNQWALLKAIAKEEYVDRITSSDFLTKYNLGAGSTVQRSLKSLLSQEMIYIEYIDDVKYYSVYDCFLGRWLERK